MKRNKMFVAGVLVATLLLVPTGLWAQGEGNQCSRDERRNCLLGSFMESAQSTSGMTFRALVTFTPGGGVIETNTGQGAPVGAHGSWAASKDHQDQFDLTLITFPLVPGTFAMAKTKETVTLSDSGDSFTAVFLVEVMDANGNVILTFAGTGGGKRIPVEPLSN